MGKMDEKTRTKLKGEFLNQLQSFAKELHSYVSTQDNQWVIKGFIDVFKNIGSVSSSVKIHLQQI